MSNHQLNSCVELDLFTPPMPPSPFPCSPVSNSAARECRSSEMCIALARQHQQQTGGWGLQGLRGRQGSSVDEKNGYHIAEELESSSGGKYHESRPSKLCSRGHWRPADDAKLRELVSQHGPQNWNLIAEKLEGRSGKSCRLRWFNQLDPRINRRAFGEAEEERLLAAHRVYGNKWALIARLFPGRTDNAVKNQWHVIMARKKREQSSGCRRRRRRPSSVSPSHDSPHGMEMSSTHIGWDGESSSSRARHESASACTDLSLNSSTIPGLFSRHGTSQQPQLFEFLMGSEEKPVAAGRSGCFEKLGRGFNDGPPRLSTMGLDQTGYAGSAAEVLATESVANHSERISLPFIDFLGIGAK